MFQTVLSFFLLSIFPAAGLAHDDSSPMLLSQVEGVSKAEETDKGSSVSPDTSLRAEAPPCVVGLKLQFQYDDNRKFTREITARDGDLCLVESGSKSYYDKDWTLVKLVEPDGREITSSSPRQPDIGEKWLPFPLSVSKKWERHYSGQEAVSGGVRQYQNYFTVVSHEDVTVPGGSFKAFKIRQEQVNLSSKNRRGVRYFWYAPDVGYYVKRHWAVKEGNDPHYWVSVRDYELVSVSRPK